MIIFNGVYFTLGKGMHNDENLISNFDFGIERQSVWPYERMEIRWLMLTIYFLGV